MSSSISFNERQLPLDMKRRHMLVRKSEWQSLTRIRATMLKSVGETLRNEGFIEVRVPTIASLIGSCENPATLYKVKYREDDEGEEYMYLIQTCQLHLEAFVYAHEKVYSINQSYRAEEKVDTRHLTEFTLIEVEAADYDLDELMRLQEKMILGMARDVLKKNKEDISIFNAGLEERSSEIERNKRKNGRYFNEITYNDAIDQISETEEGKALNLEKGEDIPSKGEKILMEQNNNLPMFITHYPKKIKYFNMEDSEQFEDRVNSCDLLMPGVGEVSGCAEREADPKKLRTKFYTSPMYDEMKKDPDMDPDNDFEWLFDLGCSDSGPVYHGGFGMGFERVVQWICNFDSILDCVEFPRNVEHANP